MRDRVFSVAQLRLLSAAEASLSAPSVRLTGVYAQPKPSPFPCYPTERSFSLVSRRFPLVVCSRAQLSPNRRGQFLRHREGEGEGGEKQTRQLMAKATFRGGCVWKEYVHVQENFLLTRDLVYVLKLW